MPSEENFKSVYLSDIGHCVQRMSDGRVLVFVDKAGADWWAASLNLNPHSHHTNWKLPNELR